MDETILPNIYPIKVETLPDINPFSDWAKIITKIEKNMFFKEKKIC